MIQSTERLSSSTEYVVHVLFCFLKNGFKGNDILFTRHVLFCYLLLVFFVFVFVLL